MPSKITADQVYARKSAGPSIRVRNASEGYSEKRAVGLHAKTKLPVFDGVYEQNAETLSEGASARHGVFLKKLAHRAGIDCPLTEHEDALLSDVCEKDVWCGKVGDEWADEITGNKRIKQLMDDALPASGGISIVPREFDSDLVSFPLLNGELLPHVTLKPVERGRRIEGASIATPTVVWGGGDGTAIVPFNTANMVNAINSTVFTMDMAIRVGRDFLSDSPVNVGTTLTALIGQRFQTELDRVIAAGNGATEPAGLIGTAGVGAVVTVNGAGGPPTLADYFGLYFGVGKQYRNSSYDCCFLSNDVTYARSRAMSVDPAAVSVDTRPVLAPLTTISDYATLQRPHLVENASIPNTTAMFVGMKSYRLYRRLGMQVEWHTQGETLALSNLALLIVRARFGGRLMDPAAATRWINGQV